MEADDYYQAGDVQHALLLPNLYIGSVRRTNLARYMFLDEVIRPQLMDIPGGLIRLFIEVLTNAADNIVRSRKLKIDAGPVYIDVDGLVVSIKNGGIPIPVDINKQTGLYVPEMIFGHMKTSSNFKVGKNLDKTNDVAGRHGYGSKLANIYSKKFEVEVMDDTRGLLYTQNWSDNMSVVSKPKIVKRNQASYVKISYLADFERFDGQCYSEDEVNVFKAFAANVSWSHRVQIIFNNEMLDFFTDPLSLGRMYFPEATQFLHFDQGNTDTGIAQVKVILADVSHDGAIISFVNGLPTTSGGEHVKALREAIVRPFLEDVLNKSEDRASLCHTLKIDTASTNISMLLSCQIPDADLGGGQNKDKLESFDIKITPPKKIMDQLKEWNFNRRMLEIIDAKFLKDLKKTDGKRVGDVYLGIGETDAGQAGKKEWEKCTCIFVEGKSASGYPEFLIEVTGGYKYNGLFPLGGKPTNFMNLSKKELINNKLYEYIRKFLGTKCDRDYSQLRYRQLRLWLMLIQMVNISLV